jgi:cytochrome P450
VTARFGATVPPGLGLSMLDRHPPDHTRLRSLVSKAFTPRGGSSSACTSSRSSTASGGSAGDHGMDLIEQFAYPLSVIVICEVLGVPVADHGRFKDCGLDIACGLDTILLPPDSEVGKRSMSARRALADYFRGLIAERRAAPPLCQDE